MASERRILVDLNDHRSARFTSRAADVAEEMLAELGQRYSVSPPLGPPLGLSSSAQRIVVVSASAQGQPIEVAYELLTRRGFFPTWGGDTPPALSTDSFASASATPAFDDQEITPVLSGSTGITRPGEGIVIAIVEVGGLDCSDPEVGGTGNPVVDREAIRRGRHDMILPFIDRKGNWIDPFERPTNGATTHGDMTVRCAAGRPVGSPRPLGAAPHARVCYVRKRDEGEIGEAIDELANQDRRIDVISVSHATPYSRVGPVERAISRGSFVVEALGPNTVGPITIPPPGRSFTVGAYDVATQTPATSYGPGLCLRATHDLKPGVQSSAVAVVAGVAALLRQRNPGWSPFEVFRALTQSAFRPFRMDGKVFDDRFGWGILRAASALALGTAELLPLPPIKITWSLIQGTRSVKIDWALRPTVNESGCWFGSFLEPDTTGIDRSPELVQRLSRGQTSTVVSFPRSGRWRVVIRTLGQNGTQSEVVPSTILPPLSNPPFIV